MTQLKIDTKIDEAAFEGLEPHIADLYDNRGSQLIGVVTLQSVDRSQPTDDSGIKPYVKVRIVQFEAVTTTWREDALRDLQEALYRERAEPYGEKKELAKLVVDRLLGRLGNTAFVEGVSADD
jgi:hypothetical protein